jgi:ankyrin repeat protein
VTDPRDDKARIEATKGPLLKSACTWILDDQSYVNWLADDVHRVLWIRGDAGKGKTMISISLVSELSNRLEASLDHDTTLAYFFCDDPDIRLNTAVCILRGLLYQMFQQRPVLIPCLREVYEKQKDKLFSSPNTLETLCGIFESILRRSDHGTIYLVIDALDECDRQTCARLLRLIKVTQHDALKVKWLLTSRNEAFIEEALSGFLQISLESNESHVNAGVGRFIQMKVQELALEKKYNIDQRTFIEEALEQKAEGTFLWVALTCQNLRNVRSIWAKKTVEQFPPTLDALYKRILDQILHNRDQEQLEFAQRILYSVVAAFRPLTIRELAIVADLPVQHRYDDNLLAQYIDVCGSLLTIRQKTVYLVHQSAKDYLLSGECLIKFSRDLTEEHTMITTRCFHYVCNGAFKLFGSSDDDDRDDEKGFDERPPLQYPIHYWIAHGRLASPDVANAFNPNDQFFQEDSILRENWASEYWEFADPDNAPPADFTTLSLAAYSGIVPLAEKLRHLWRAPGAGAKGYDRPPLAWAASEGQYAMVKWLLDWGADLYGRQESSGCTALHFAAANGHKAVVQLLLEKGMDVDTPGKNGLTAAFDASSYEQEEVLVLLLEEWNADIEARWMGNTMLLEAVNENSESVTKVLLQLGANPNAKDEYGNTPLHYADEAMTRMLLRRGADPNIRNKKGETSLHSAAFGGREAIFRLLLKDNNGANINAEDSDGRTALHLTAMRGHRKATELLLEHGANPNAQDKAGHTALYYATMKGNEAAARPLGVPAQQGQVAGQHAARAQQPNALSQVERPQSAPRFQQLSPQSLFGHRPLPGQANNVVPGQVLNQAGRGTLLHQQSPQPQQGRQPLKRSNSDEVMEFPSLKQRRPRV